MSEEVHHHHTRIYVLWIQMSRRGPNVVQAVEPRNIKRLVSPIEVDLDTFLPIQMALLEICATSVESSASSVLARSHYYYLLLHSWVMRALSARMAVFHSNSVKLASQTKQPNSQELLKPNTNQEFWTSTCSSNGVRPGEAEMHWLPIFYDCRQMGIRIPKQFVHSERKTARIPDIPYGLTRGLDHLPARWEYEDGGKPGIWFIHIYLSLHTYIYIWARRPICMYECACS